MGHMLNQTKCTAPSQEPSLEVARNNGMSIRDTITDIEGAVQKIEDFLQGARPEKPQEDGTADDPAGILAQLCMLGANNHDRLTEIQRRLSRTASSLGVQM